MRWLLSAALVAGFMAGCDDEKGCTTAGDSCDNSCPTGEVGICAAKNLCVCVPEGSGGNGGDIGGDGGDGGGVAPNCRLAEPGELVINEVLIDGIVASGSTEKDEFVEIVSLAAEPVDVGGVKVRFTNKSVVEPKDWVTLPSTCLPAHGFVVAARNTDYWRWSEGVTVENPTVAGGFTNSADPYQFSLVFSGDRAGEPVTVDAIKTGVSMARLPDYTGALVLHDTIPGALATSPGVCSNGGTFAQSCTDGLQIECVVDGDCTEGKVCVAAQCIDPPATCQNRADCGTVLLCEGGACVKPPACVEDEDCGSADLACTGGLCVEKPGCSGDDECQDTEICVNRACVPGDCEGEAPVAGDLILNEVLIDGAVPTTEDDEFVELVNASARTIKLEGVVVAYTKADARKAWITFTAGGCLPSRGSVVLAKGAGYWRWSDGAAPGTFTVTNNGFSNTGPYSFTVELAAGTILDQVAVERIKAGVSMTRDPDLSGALRLHDELPGGFLTSPGLCNNGATFEDGCVLPACPDNQPRDAQGRCPCRADQIRDPATQACRCADGQVEQGGACVLDPLCPDGSARPESGVCPCPDGQEVACGACVAVCAAEQERVNCACVARCTPPKVRDEAGSCVCPAGQIPDGDGCREPDPACGRAPVAGELVINEVMVDGGEVDEPDEFVELVNVSGEALDLTGLVLSSNVGDPANNSQRARVTFQSGCLAACGVVAMFRAPERWVWQPAALGTPTFTTAAFGFPNTQNFDFRLTNAAGQVIAQAQGLKAAFGNGISAVRSPDVIEPANWVRHSDATAGARNSSPGFAISGEPLVCGP